MACAEDALNAKARGGSAKNARHQMGRKGPKDAGTPKGMKRILNEIGVNATKTKGDEMRNVRQKMHYFKNEKAHAEKLLMDNGFRGYFIPKFHCELNPIERVWAESKRYSREHCDYTFLGLEHTIEPSLHSISVGNILGNVITFSCLYKRGYYMA